MRYFHINQCSSLSLINALQFDINLLQIPLNGMTACESNILRDMEFLLQSPPQISKTTVASLSTPYNMWSGTVAKIPYAHQFFLLLFFLQETVTLSADNIQRKKLHVKHPLWYCALFSFSSNAGVDHWITEGPAACFTTLWRTMSLPRKLWWSDLYYFTYRFLQTCHSWRSSQLPGQTVCTAATVSTKTDGRFGRVDHAPHMVMSARCGMHYINISLAHISNLINILPIPHENVRISYWFLQWPPSYGTGSSIRTHVSCHTIASCSW